MATNKQLIERWKNVERVLRGLTPHQRKLHWDMTTFGTQTDCGTIACAAGHCGMDPWFRRRGFKLAFYEQKFGSREIRLPRVDNLHEFFGTPGVSAIFLNTKRRAVGAVIREVRAHIKTLQSQE